MQIGSITGGGRYDNLTGIFGMPGLSGVGISFGADRIYDVLNTLDLYPKESVQALNSSLLTLVRRKQPTVCLSLQLLDVPEYVRRCSQTVQK